MKLYAQMGHGDGQKTLSGLTEGLIDGAILSPRDWRPDGIGERIGELTAAKEDADILIDPQFYATFAASSAAARTGNLPDWPYFSAVRKSDLELGAEVDRVLREAMGHVVGLPVTGVIAPNIYISRSFDSREAVIAKNFVRSARGVYGSVGDSRPLYATIAVCREALLERTEFEEFLNDVTMLSDPPDGFYLLIGSRGTEAQTDIFHADVIARWMLLNYSLKVNGYEIVNGYSDVLTPFLGSVGGDAGAAGWYSNLRTFSLDRFQPPPSGGRRPIKRYLSTRLLNRVTFTEREALSDIVPSVTNGLSHDADYRPEPDTTSEILQSWEALGDLSQRLAIEDVDASLAACGTAVTRAEAAYSEIAEAGVNLDRKSADDHLAPLREGIQAFKEMAGLA
ncbi:MAG: hypothetical protein HQ559_13665 [Lentisphaerae bacterium]|nr:hypothetical protein [Lentisphaerota bacterium]